MQRAGKVVCENDDKIERSNDNPAPRLALAEEAVLRDRLLVIVHPRRQVRVRVRIDVPAARGPRAVSTRSTRKAIRGHALVDVRRGGEVLRVAADVDGVWLLVDADPVDAHRRGEREMLDVDEAEVLGHAQVHDDVLRAARQHSLDIGFETVAGGRTIGSTGMGRGPISTRVSAAMPAALIVHAAVPFWIQVMYCAGRCQREHRIEHGQPCAPHRQSQAYTRSRTWRNRRPIARSMSVLWYGASAYHLRWKPRG